MVSPLSPVAPGGPVLEAPSRRGHVIGLAIIVLSGVIGGVMVVIGFMSLAQMLRFPTELNAEGSVELAEPGNFIVYEITLDTVTSTPAYTVGSLHLEGPSGTVPLAPYVGDRSVTSGTRKAFAVATFHADRAGRYTLTTSDIGTRSEFGIGDGTKIRGAILALGFVIGGAGFVVGIIVMIMTAVRNGNRKRAALAMTAGTTSWGQQGWAPPVQPGVPNPTPGYPPASPGGYPPAAPPTSAPPTQAPPGGYAPPPTWPTPPTQEPPGPVPPWQQ